jgi:cytochrome c-type biogenesis protein
MAQAVQNSPGTPRTNAAPAVSWRITFTHAVAFVLGFGLVFTLLGSAAGLLGYRLTVYLPYLQKGGAILLVIFGLTTLGVFRWAVKAISQRTDLTTNPAAAGLVDVLDFFNVLLYTERRVTEMHQVKRGWGYVSSLLMGVSFSAGWVPCVGPILASILFIASESATAGTGAALLAIYSLGLGIPFLIVGAAFSSSTGFLRRLNRHANVVSLISGLFLLVMAWMLWSDQLAFLTTQFSGLNELVLDLEDALTGSFGHGVSLNANVISAAPLAFLAGVISFISPCVLPLVPAYIGYLSGASLGNRG